MPQMPAMPMLAVPGRLPTGAGWAFEFKWDGLRAIALVAGGQVHLFSRSGHDISAAYPELAGLGAVARHAVLDGEIVLLDEAGAPSFAALGARMRARDAAHAAKLAAGRPVTYMIFDLLALDGVDWTGRRYAQRRAALAALVPDSERWLVPPHFTDGPATYAAAAEHNLEGVVAKRLDSPYRPGQRSTTWVKIKREQSGEFVIGGWRPGARRLGSLLVGTPVPGGGLAYRGRVGGGISARAEQTLLAALEPLATPHSPFVTELAREDTRGVTWVRPYLVVAVRYGEQTPDGRLRFPSFQGLLPGRSVDDGDTP